RSAPGPLLWPTRPAPTAPGRRGCPTSSSPLSSCLPGPGRPQHDRRPVVVVLGFLVADLPQQTECADRGRPLLGEPVGGGRDPQYVAETVGGENQHLSVAEPDLRGADLPRGVRQEVVHPSL